jgi:hypothetical protein
MQSKSALALFELAVARAECPKGYKTIADYCNDEKMSRQWLYKLIAAGLVLKRKKGKFSYVRLKKSVSGTAQ